MDVVNEFRGPHLFLSNFYRAPFEWRGIEFPSGEHAFSYAKTFYCMTSLEGTWAPEAILQAPKPVDAKRIGRKLEIAVKEWDRNKVQHMREIVHAKFATAGGGIVGDLINTGSAMLVEGNDWNDTFWGRCKRNGEWVGLNKLGVILMEERGYWLHYE